MLAVHLTMKVRQIQQKKEKTFLLDYRAKIHPLGCRIKGFPLVYRIKVDCPQDCKEGILCPRVSR